MDSALAAAPHLDVPLLLMYGARDEVVPRRPIAEFAARLPAEPRQPRRLAYYPAGYHLLLRDLGGGIVANDIASWIADPRAPLPSGADAAAAAPGWPPIPENAPEPGTAAREVSGAGPPAAAPRAPAGPRG
jgi:dienelactone hydrolase